MLEFGAAVFEIDLVYFLIGEDDLICSNHLNSAGFFAEVPFPLANRATNNPVHPVDNSVQRSRRSNT